VPLLCSLTRALGIRSEHSDHLSSSEHGGSTVQTRNRPCADDGDTMSRRS